MHLFATAYFAAMVVRDILVPEADPVRSDGVPEHRDDPGGGVLDGAEDRWVLRRREQPVDAEPAMAGSLPTPDHLHD